MRNRREDRLLRVALNAESVSKRRLMEDLALLRCANVFQVLLVTTYRIVHTFLDMNSDEKQQATHARATAQCAYVSIAASTPRGVEARGYSHDCSG